VGLGPYSLATARLPAAQPPTGLGWPRQGCRLALTIKALTRSELGLFNSCLAIYDRLGGPPGLGHARRDRQQKPGAGAQADAAELHAGKQGKLAY